MKDPKVDEYIKKQPAEYQEILKKLRSLISKTFPGIQEGFSWGVPVYDGGRFYLASLKNQVNFGFSIIGLDKEDVNLFKGSGKTARHIKVKKYNSEMKKKLIPLMKLVKKKAGIPQ